MEILDWLCSGEESVYHIAAGRSQETEMARTSTAAPKDKKDRNGKK